MGWGEPHTNSVGTTGQVEEAHKALDAVGVEPGPLAIRVLKAAGQIDYFREIIEDGQ